MDIHKSITKEIQTLFTTNSRWLIRNSEGKIVEKGSLWEKMRYVALCIFTIGHYSVKHRYKKYCALLENACMRPSTNERITVANTCQVFQKIFPDNESLVEAANQLQSAKDKASRSAAKQDVKETINELLTGGYYGANSQINILQEINLHPRLAEAKFALSKKVKAPKIEGEQLSTVHKVYDRTGKKCLAIFKLCQEKSNDAVNELKVWNQLGKPNSINVKKTLYSELSIEGRKNSGIFQKFIKGKTLLNAATDTRNIQIDNLLPEAKDELHRIAIFDLINHNSDRHGDNLMVDEKGHLWAIDHGLLLDGLSANSQSFIPNWASLANQPFSEEVKQYIKNLDLSVHCDRKMDSEMKKYSKIYIDFLKFAIAEERPVELTLYQIYRILQITTSEIDKLEKYDNESFEKILDEGIRKLISENDSHRMYTLLFRLFPSLKEKFYADGIIHGFEIKMPFNSYEMLEKVKERNSFLGLGPELCLETILNEEEFINQVRNGKKLTSEEVSVALGKFSEWGFENVMKEIARNTKYYDKEKEQFTPEMQSFIDRWWS